MKKNDIPFSWDVRVKERLILLAKMLGLLAIGLAGGRILCVWTGIDYKRSPEDYKKHAIVAPENVQKNYLENGGR